MSGGRGVALSLGAVLAACADRAPSTDAPADAPRSAVATADSSAPASDLLEARVPRAVAGDPRWRYEQRVSADLDGDGSSEAAVLICDVTLDERGRPLWEDGHRWQVYVEEPEGGARTHVYARFLPNGKLTAELTEPDSGAMPTILLLEQTPHHLGVYELRYAGPGRVAVVSHLARPLDPVRQFVGAPRP
ncbi:MAG TPA: hypothetical protein VNA89_08655 [Gemmatimonadaceae bacterium]|nr:hypothetical protein [Gemmatimonadaceae bacterium]